MTDPTAEVRGYADAVRHALADVPAERLEELLEDLDDHLAEVAAEGGGPLEQRLGPPAEYARELRAAAGLPDPAPAEEPRAGLRAELAAMADVVRGASATRSVVAFLPELRPAWWVVRAWAAVTAVDVVFFDSGSFPVPTFGVSGVLGLLATAAAVVWSVRLGLRARSAGRAPGRPAVVVNGLLGVLALVAVVGVADRPASGYVEPASWGDGAPGSLAHEDGTPITNIHPYSSTGEPLTGVLLYDQDGRPIDDLAGTDADGNTVQTVPGSPFQPGNAFPQQREVVTWDGSGAEVTRPMPPVPPTPGPVATSTGPVPSTSPVPSTTPSTTPESSPVPWTSPTPTPTAAPPS